MADGTQSSSSRPALSDLEHLRSHNNECIIVSSVFANCPCKIKLPRSRPEHATSGWDPEWLKLNWCDESNIEKDPNHYVSVDHSDTDKLDKCEDCSEKIINILHGVPNHGSRDVGFLLPDPIDGPGPQCILHVEQCSCLARHDITIALCGEHPDPRTFKRACRLVDRGDGYRHDRRMDEEMLKHIHLEWIEETCTRCIEAGR